jgi:nicotinate dehydrogenase subunit B
MPTPFGTLYASNITPDPGHGIGGWSEAAYAALSETELRDLARFMRAHFTDLPAWPERAGG